MGAGIVAFNSSHVSKHAVAGEFVEFGYCSKQESDGYIYIYTYTYTYIFIYIYIYIYIYI